MPVPVITLANETVRESSRYLASLSSRRSVVITPQVAGYVTAIFVKPGDPLKAGRPIALIDPEKERADLQNLEAVRKAKETVFTLAQRNRSRTKDLLDHGVVAQQEFDARDADLQTAEAELKAADAAIASQKVVLERHQIVSPFEGVVGDVPVKVGDYVGPQTPLTTLDQSTALEAYVSVPVERAGELTADSAIQLLGPKGEVLVERKVGFVSPKADLATQSLLIKVDFANERALRADQVVPARVIWSAHPGLEVPAEAVTLQSGQHFVFLVAQTEKGTVAKQVPVEVGDIDGNRYVIKSGLRVGDRLIVGALQKIGDGAPVQPQPLAAADASRGRPALTGSP